MEQSQLLDFLMGCEQVTLDPVGEKAERLWTHALFLPRKPAGDPLRQLRAFDRTGFDDLAGAGQRLEPFAVLRGAVEPGQRNHDYRVRWQVAGLRFERLNRLPAKRAGFAGDERIVRDDEAQIPPVQLADDLVDLTSDSVDSGKTPGTDLKEGVPTLAGLIVLRDADGNGSADRRAGRPALG